MARLRRLQLHVLALPCAAALVCAAAPAAGAPALRKQVDLKGDFALIGNSLGFDCATGVPAPIVGTVGPCGGQTDDSGIDVLWRADEPDPGAALAATTVKPGAARSTAVLTLPAGATVTYARLYWAAVTTTSASGLGSATLERPGVASVVVTADTTKTSDKAGGFRWYQSTADVTQSVTDWGSGPMRVSGISIADPTGKTDNLIFAGWSMVVFYADKASPPRNLALFDGLDDVSNGNPASASIAGFLVPDSGYAARLGVVAYEGDVGVTGDALVFNGTALSDAKNPADNFFDGSRSALGAAVSTPGDLPQLSGEPGSMTGIDLDVVDVTSLVAPGATSATISATSTGDTYALGVLVTSVSLLSPSIVAPKTAIDANGGALVAGDVLTYAIEVHDEGTDDAVLTTLTDALPTGVTFVPGSLRVQSGAQPVVPLTDASGDDTGEYDVATRTVTVRLGEGATATEGGTLAVGASVTVTFQVTIDAGFSGSLSNQAQISAGGKLGAKPASFPSSGAAEGTPTTVVVDACAGDGDCPSSTPVCLPGVSPRVCVACVDSAACKGTTPVCDAATHACVPCGATAPCTSAAHPICKTTGADAGACVACVVDATCGTTTSGIVCASSGECVPGCSVAPGRNGCPSGQTCSDTTGAVGACGTGGTGGTGGAGGSAGKGGAAGAGGAGAAGKSGAGAGGAGAGGAGAGGAGGKGAASGAGAGGSGAGGKGGAGGAGAAGKGGASGAGAGGKGGASGGGSGGKSGGGAGGAGNGGLGGAPAVDPTGDDVLEGSGCTCATSAPRSRAGAFVSLVALGAALLRRRWRRR